ncbi:MAG TPA: NUDIX hydrolase [Candidatus Saccharimonadales bacterium]|nr:NUDIX hydrolase [Candidatus Saccharimonadales bacterium]
MKTAVIAKTVVQDEEGRVLLLRRSSTDIRRPGEWDFPGGSVDAGEGLAQGAAREIREEIGLVVTAEVMRLVYAATEAYPDASVTRLLFAVTVKDAEVTVSEEHDAYQWVDIPTALKQFPHPFYSVGLAYAQKHSLLRP